MIVTVMISSISVKPECRFCDLIFISYSGDVTRASADLPTSTFCC